MRDLILRTLVSRLLLGGLLTAGVIGAAAAQESTPESGRGHHPIQAAPAGSPYAGRYDPDVPPRALTAEEIDQIERGQGAGFALPAELNGVPGPRHVLDMADELGLSAAQRTRVQAISDDMGEAAISAGQRYLDGAQRLEEDFRLGTLTEAELPDRVADVARLAGELAAAHLLAHLKTADVLTAEQIVEYNRLRGYT